MLHPPVAERRPLGFSEHDQSARQSITGLHRSC